MEQVGLTAHPTLLVGQIQFQILFQTLALSVILSRIQCPIAFQILSHTPFRTLFHRVQAIVLQTVYQTVYQIVFHAPCLGHNLLETLMDFRLGIPLARHVLKARASDKATVSLRV